MNYSSEEILFSEIPGRYGDLGLVVLNRPRALNALSQAMCIALSEQLAVWAKAETIKAVAVRGNGERAFCAGGDIRCIYETGQTNLAAAQQFFCCGRSFKILRCISTATGCR